MKPLAALFNKIYVRAPEGVPREHRQLLILVGAAMFIAGYDLNIYGFASRQIQQSFAIPESDIGLVIAYFRLGMIPALFLAYLADRIGRRILLLITMTGAIAATVWTAFAQSLEEFIAAQILARMFIYTEELVCVVVITEVFSERSRGWAIGQLGALAALGGGTAAIVFAFVNQLPFGWRALYVLGAIPLLWLLWARRALPETERFLTQQAKGHAHPWRSLFHDYPHRLALVVLIAFSFTFAMGGTVVMFSPFLQSAHGWQPYHVTTLTLVAGFVAILGNTLAGTWSDRVGRRTVIAATMLVSALSFSAFYGIASGWWLALFWTTGLFSFMAADILLAGMSAELFPTSHRTLASWIRFAAWLAGGFISLFVGAELFQYFGNHGDAIATLALLAPLSIIPVMFLPESATKRLEDISEERLP